MNLVDAGKAAVLVFCAAIVQVTLLSSVDVLHGRPDLVLVTLVAVSLLRGSIFGASAGFGAGLIIDTATFQTLGLTSFLLTLAGYWIGRYGETTGRDRTHAPYVSVAVVTVLYAVGALVLHYMLGDAAPAKRVLVDSLLPKVVFNLLLTYPVYLLVRRLLATPTRADAAEVRLLG